MQEVLDFPDSFYCPLTREPMLEPFVDPEGNSFERGIIFQWLENNAFSPLTGTSMKFTDLRPNVELKRMIEAARKFSPVSTSQSTEEIQVGSAKLLLATGEMSDLPLEEARTSTVIATFLAGKPHMAGSIRNLSNLVERSGENSAAFLAGIDSAFQGSDTTTVVVKQVAHVCFGQLWIIRLPHGADFSASAALACELLKRKECSGQFLPRVVAPLIGGSVASDNVAAIVQNIALMKHLERLGIGFQSLKLFTHQSAAISRLLQSGDGPKLTTESYEDVGAAIQDLYQIPAITPLQHQLVEAIVGLWDLFLVFLPVMSGCRPTRESVSLCRSSNLSDTPTVVRASLPFNLTRATVQCGIQCS